MSTGSEMEVTCSCGHHFRTWLWQSANVTASPELRERILGGELNIVGCPECGNRFHVEMPFLYHDLTDREWIWVYPRDHEKESASVRDRIQDMWNRLVRMLPPDAARSFREEYRVMVLFGMDALVYYLRSKEGGAGPNR